VQPSACLGDDVLLVVPSGDLVGQLLIVLALRSLVRLELTDLGLLGQVDPQWVGVGEGERQQQ
jgi:hypothetical protein